MKRGKPFRYILLSSPSPQISDMFPQDLTAITITSFCISFGTFLCQLNVMKLLHYIFIQVLGCKQVQDALSILYGVANCNQVKPKTNEVSSWSVQG
jgi:hypothetical protein